MDSPAKLSNQGTQDEKKSQKKKKQSTLQHNICWMPLCANQNK